MLASTRPSALKPYIIVIVMILVLVVQFCSFLSTKVRRSKRSENKRNKRSLLRNLCRSAAFCSVSFGNSWSDCRLKVQQDDSVSFSNLPLCRVLLLLPLLTSLPPQTLTSSLPRHVSHLQNSLFMHARTPAHGAYVFSQNKTPEHPERARVVR